MKSFNEDEEIFFDPVPHTYTWKGKTLTSGTTWLKQYLVPFEKDRMADLCANRYGLNAIEVKQLWEDKGASTREYGTAIHLVMENYFKHVDTGKVIHEMDDRKSFNDGIPRHPHLYQIVQSFLDQYTYKPEKLVTEALVSQVKWGYCGLVDLLCVLDSEKKIARVQDYKVNVDPDKVSDYPMFVGKYSHLEASKLSKYQLQMSFYAALLIESGWDIVGLDAYVLEDNWKHYPLDLIDLV